MANLAPLFTSERTDWETPQPLFDRLNLLYHFNLDLAATADNAKCERYYSPVQDAFKQPWVGRCWLNPPYGRGRDGIKRWVARAHRAAESGECEFVVLLIPARTDTDWWWNHVIEGCIDFIPGRLHFVGGESGAPFPSAVVAFHAGLPLHWRRVHWWDWQQRGYRAAS